MRHEVLMAMSKKELDQYAEILGLNVSGEKSIAKKVSVIEKAREKTASVEALGLTLTIPIKRMRDKRVTDLANKRPITDEGGEELLRLVLGDEQFEMLVDHATDEDGSIDTDAMGFALVKIITSEELKNF